MSQHRSDTEIINKTHNTARFFVETRHVAWVLLIATCLWGVYGYLSMPQRKDPESQVRTAVALTPWRGASAEKIEQLVTKKVETQMAANAKVTKIESISRTGLSVVYLELDENLKETGKELDDIKLKLDGIYDLPEGAGPINFIKDFGDTAALMLTVASPKASDLEIELRAKAIQSVIEQARAQTLFDAPPSGENAPGRAALIACLPQSIAGNDLQPARKHRDLFVEYLREQNVIGDARPLEGAGFIGVDAAVSVDDATLLKAAETFVRERLQAAEFHPDSWPIAVIHDPRETRERLAAVAGDKYSYREMDQFTDLIEKTIKTLPMVSKVSRTGLLEERVFLYYSQERLAAYGIRNAKLPDILSARNITLPGGQLEAGGKNLSIDPTGEFKSEKEIGEVALATSENGAPVYLRDLADVVRGYESPARFLNYYNWRDAQGVWRRTRAVTLSAQMRSGEQIANFGAAIDATLADLKKRLPEDLMMARTSDQPLQVRENINLFMNSLYEAVILVVIVSLIGFWEWRSAALMALSIPITLLMTFGMMHALGIDLQQVSVASLIIALGLLVDDPVVAGDAIKRDMAAGHPSVISAWLGPTKLASAIMYATVTNIVAYLPFLLLGGGTGEFIYSLPVVMTCSLVASRVVSMTFIPLLGYYLLRPKASGVTATGRWRKLRSLSLSILTRLRLTSTQREDGRKKGFAAFYYRVGNAAINHRWKFLAASLAFLGLGGFFASQLKQSFFPKDLSYLSYVDVWLPEDAPLAATDEAALRAEEVIRREVKKYGEERKNPDVLQSLTTFIGGGGPRFWFSVAPELQQLNYAQIIIQVKDKHDTEHLIEPLQKTLSAEIAGARIDVRQLELGKAIGLPVAVRISGDDAARLRAEAERVKDIFRESPLATRVRDDWGDESFTVRLRTDPDRANLAGVSNYDVAAASSTAISGEQVTSLREGDKQIPVVARLRMEERAQLADINNLYVYSSQGAGRVPLGVVSSVEHEMQTEKLRRRNQFRTITVSCFPKDGALPSEVMSASREKLNAFAAALPPGYKMEIGGEEEEQVKGFKDLAVVLLISIIAIFLALVFQFKHAIKPLIVFAAIPFGMVGALAALWVMGSPFGFMAFLGCVSLVGVIVSHVIVLFDFIEEAHERGESLREALLDAGIMRLRPVMITVGATVFALFPLASHGGPLWEPMCYAQIGGLSVATFVTLLLVPVIYAIFVLDLKLVKWDAVGGHTDGDREVRGGDRPIPPLSQEGIGWGG
ncbi:MAG TPA: efflux RND transporter permease subunit [Blastocatellia bacterium]|nr:efflux RND transporter permease subunit [Blastocatellia bacterium]